MRIPDLRYDDAQHVKKPSSTNVRQFVKSLALVGVLTGKSCFPSHCLSWTKTSTYICVRWSRACACTRGRHPDSHRQRLPINLWTATSTPWDASRLLEQRRFVVAFLRDAPSIDQSGIGNAGQARKRGKRGRFLEPQTAGSPTGTPMEPHFNLRTSRSRQHNSHASNLYRCAVPAPLAELMIARGRQQALARKLNWANQYQRLLDAIGAIRNSRVETRKGRTSILSC
nr:hypothetical protein CFP56_20552 [Quercus suber]